MVEVGVGLRADTTLSSWETRWNCAKISICESGSLSLAQFRAPTHGSELVVVYSP